MQQSSAEEQERIRRAYHLEHKSIRAIAKEFRHSRTTVSKVLADETKKPQQVTNNRQTPVFGPHQSRVEELLRLNEGIPARLELRSRSLGSRVCQGRKEGCQQLKEHTTQITSSFAFRADLLYARTGQRVRCPGNW